MELGALVVICTIGLAYAFDFINGFHDASNAIATIVATEVLTPKQAVLWAAFFNFIAFLFFDLTVAQTIGQGILSPEIINLKIIISTLIGAISWNLLTWYCGLPSSSSHALIGGLAGAGIAQSGLSSLYFEGLYKVGFGIFITPLIGLLAGFIISSFGHQISKSRHRSPEKITTLFKRLQLLSSAILSVAHGSNDAQKTMGIITILLYSVGWLKGDFNVPFWVVITCQSTISFGTLFGGWRIVHTVGHSISKLNPMKGSAAETAAAIVILTSTECGIPVSTTQTVTGTITGVGLQDKANPPHWRIVKLIFIAWIITLPASGLISSICMNLFLV